MGEYADIKLKRVLNFFKWLSNKCSNIEIVKGGKHNYSLKYSFARRPYPIPMKHGRISKVYIKELMKLLTEEWKVCTKEEFDDRIK